MTDFHCASLSCEVIRWWSIGLLLMNNYCNVIDHNCYYWSHTKRSYVVVKINIDIVYYLTWDFLAMNLLIDSRMHSFRRHIKDRHTPPFSRMTAYSHDSPIIYFYYTVYQLELLPNILLRKLFVTYCLDNMMDDLSKSWRPLSWKTDVHFAIKNPAILVMT